jgi:hypothetical protein
VKNFSSNLEFQHLMFRFILGTLLLASPLFSQTATSTKLGAIRNTAAKFAAIESFRIIQEKDGQAVEILSTKPLLPSIQALTNPDRLVIDFPSAQLDPRLDPRQRQVSVQADQISTISAAQIQQNPPIARVVVDLLEPRAYTWDAAGNRLVVHLGRSPTEAMSAPFESTTVPSLTRAPQPVVAAVRTSEGLALAADHANAGSTFTAGPDTAILNLSRGGQVNVCPETTVSIMPSDNRHNIMLTMNTGALETHFALDTSSDSVITPDFHILLVGPGEFHYAISADNQGNTCVRALPGNTASAIVSELLGDRTYQVKATDQLVFHSGQLDRVDTAVPMECGCPPPRGPTLLATNNPMQGPPPTGTLPPPAAPPDASVASNQLHVEIEAPFEFHATGPRPAPVDSVQALPLDARPASTPPLAAPLPPAATETPQPDAMETKSAKPVPPRGFFRRLGGFFAALFH